MTSLFGIVPLLLALLSGREPNQDTFEQTFQRALQAHLGGRFDESIEAYRQCLDLRPNHPLSAYQLACSYSRKGEADAAFDWLGKSMAWGRLMT